jgi:hypothetical protein
VPKSSRPNMFGTNNRGQAVTVIEARTRYSQRRKATVAFWVTLFTIGLLTGTVASHYWHPIVCGLFGAVVGAVLGAVLFALIIAWPVLRIVWWWLPEIGLGVGVVYGWTWLMMATPLWLALTIVSVGVGLPAAFRRSRQLVWAPVWCLTVRHRLRTCFAAFIATNRSGTLPLILWARPTPAGERVWIWLRPGLSIKDLEQDGQVQKLAVACWANEARVTRASRRYAAFIRVDITRRDPLADTIVSNLPDRVPADLPATAPVSPALPPLGINLADVPSATRPVRSPFDLNESRPRRSRRPEPPDPGDVDPSDYA